MVWNSKVEIKFNTNRYSQHLHALFLNTKLHPSVLHGIESCKKKKSPREDMDRAPPSLTPAIELLRTSPAPSLTPKNQALPPSSTLVSKVSKSSSSVSVDLPVVDVDPVVSSSSFSSGVPRLPSRGLAPPRRGLHHRTLPELHPAMASVELHLAPTCHGHHRGAQLLPTMASITLCPSSAQL